MFAVGLVLALLSPARAQGPSLNGPPPAIAPPVAPTNSVAPPSTQNSAHGVGGKPLALTLMRLPTVDTQARSAAAPDGANSQMVKKVDQRLSDLDSSAPGNSPRPIPDDLPTDVRMLPPVDSRSIVGPSGAAAAYVPRSGDALNAAYLAGQPESIPRPVGQELDSLRRELRQTNDRLGAAERELSTTRQFLQGGDAAPSSNSQPDRLSSLETAFDRFRDQLTSEKSAKFPSARVTGFTQLDTYTISQDQLSKATVGDAQDGIGFRRARFAVVGNVATFTAYMMEVDFATAGRPSFFDMWTEQDNVPIFGAVRVGQYLQPFSVDAMSGFRNLPFLERSLPFLAFVPFRRVGMMSSINTRDELSYLAYSFYRTGGFNNAPEGDSRFATDIGDQGGLSFSSRGTTLLKWDPIAEDMYFWQVGASYNYSRMSGNSASGQRPYYQARSGPEFGPIGDGLDTIPATFGPVAYASGNFTPPNFVDSGRYLADSFNLFGVETLYQSGPFSAQGEFMATGVNSVAGPIWYTGAYGEVMYRLTGEHRGYDRRLGALKNPVPFTNFISLRPGGVKGWGAFEVAARLSYVELRNPSSLTAADYIAGTNRSGNGTLTDSTLGITWWLNYHTKFQINWIHAMLNNAQKGYSLADNFVTRFQVDF